MGAVLIIDVSLDSETWVSHVLTARAARAEGLSSEQRTPAVDTVFWAPAQLKGQLNLVALAFN